MSDKKSAVNDVGPVLTEPSPSKGLLKGKNLNASPSKKSVTFEEPGQPPVASPPQQIVEVPDLGTQTKKAPPPKKWKNLQITVQRVECLYNAGALDTADPQVTIRFNGVPCATRVVDNNAMPFFEETFSFLLSEEEWQAWKYGPEPAKGSPGSILLEIVEADFTGQVVRGRREGSLKTILGKTEKRGKWPVELYAPEPDDKNAAAGGGRAARARVVLGWALSDVIPASHLGKEEEGGAFLPRPDDFRSASGVLIATVHHLEGIKAAKGQLEVIAQLTNIKDGNKHKRSAPLSSLEGQRCKLEPCLKKATKGQSETEKNAALKEDHYQGKSGRLLLASDELLEEELSLFICTKGGEVAVFRQQLTHALSLVDGGTPMLVFEAEAPGGQAESSTKPKLVVTLSYVNSIYTRKKGKGRMWVTFKPSRVVDTGPNEMPKKDPLTGTHATLKLLGNDEKEIPKSKWSRDAKVKGQHPPGVRVELVLPGGTMQKLELTLFKQAEGAFAGIRGPTEIAKFEFCFAELFGNRRIPQLDERYLDREKVDKKNEHLMTVDLTGEFDPDDATAAERAEWARNKNVRGPGLDRQQRGKGGAAQLVAEKQEARIEVVAEKKLSPFDYQARDLFELSLPAAPLFAEQPKGVVVLRLSDGINIQWDSGVARSLYLLISTGKEIYRTKSVACSGADPPHWGNEIVKLCTGDRADQIYFKLYEDSKQAGPSVLLAEGTLRLQMILVDTHAFQAARATVSFDVFGESWGTPLRVAADDGGKKLGQMGVGLMYRCSELTKDPRGKLELSLSEATGLANSSSGRDSPECHPAVEFVLNNQRVLVKSKLLDPTREGKHTQRRSWEANRTCLDTYSALDILQINFYDDKEGKLLGCEYRDVSALWLTSTTPEAAARQKKKDATKASEFENTINIDLRRLPHLKGHVTISCRFLPRKTPNQKLDIRNKLREAMIEAQQKSLRDATPKEIRKDACAAMLGPKSGPALCNQVSYISMDLLQLRYIDARKALPLRYIAVEFAYGEHRHVSRCTLDLGQTRNQECLDHFFRVNLKDLSLRAREDGDFSVFDDHDIIITAYSVLQNAAKKDVLQEGAEAGNRVPIGQCRLPAALLRQAQCTDLRFNCGIAIPEAFFSGVEQSPGAGDEAYEQEEKDALSSGPARALQEEEDFGDGELEQAASGLLSRMGQDLRAMQSLSGKAPAGTTELGPTDAMIVLKVSIFTAHSRIIRSPVGILSLSNFQLYNSAACLGDLNLASPPSSLVLSIESNGVVHASGPAVEVTVSETTVPSGVAAASERPPDKDFCLKSADGRVLQSFMREGKAFYLNHAYEDVEEFETFSAKAAAKRLEWPVPAMFNLFCSQALNEIELALMFRSGETSEYKKISRADLNLADVSLFMDGGKETDTLNLALELDFQQLSAKAKGPSAARHQAKYDLVGFAYEDQTPATSFKNLLGHYYDHKLILTMQVNYNTEIVREARQLGEALRGHPKTISCIQNAFLMPQRVKYKDYIANGYDELVKKQVNREKQQQAAMSGGLGSEPAEPKHVPKNVLVDLQFKSLESLLKQHAGSTGATTGFLAFEPIYEVKTAIISDYLAAVPEKLAEAVNVKALEDQRTQALRKNLGEVADSSIVLPQFLLPVSLQLSEIFSFNGHQSQSINESLKCWVNPGVTKIVLSFISRRNKSSEIHAFREKLSQQPVMQAHNILGIVKAHNKALPSAALDQPDQQISISQAILDIEGALDHEKKAPDGSLLGTQSSRQICQSIALRSLDESVGDELDSKPKTPTASLCTLAARVSTSAFIDCPSGDVDVIIKRLSANHEKAASLHTPLHCIRVSLVSPVAKDNIRSEVDVSSKNDQAETAIMSHYSNKPSAADGYDNILVNHVTNLVSRHYMDKICVQLIHKGTGARSGGGAPAGEEAMLTTMIELNKLPIRHNQALSFTVMATGAQSRQTKRPHYYKIELDLVYRSRDSSAGGLAPLEQAIENYKLMMGKASLTPIEVEILKMLLERQALAKWLTTSRFPDRRGVTDLARLRMRKARFFFRRLSKLQYRTLDNKKGLTMLVSPLTYLFKVFSSGTFGRSYDHFRVLHLRQRVEKELQACKPLPPGLKEALERAKRSSGVENDEFVNFKEGNLLQVDFPATGIDLAAYGIKGVQNKAMQIKKLALVIQLCQAGKPSKTVFTKEYSKQELEGLDRIFKGQQAFIPNVNPGVEVKFALMVVPEAQVSAGGVQSMKAEVLRAHGQPASLYLSEHADKVKNNLPIPVTLSLCKQQLPIAFRVVQNALTRQPHRVIEITFHRLMKLEEDAFVSRELLDQAATKSRWSEAAGKEGADRVKLISEALKKQGQNGAPNHVNLVLAEKECVANANEVMRAEELAALEGEEAESTDTSSGLAKGEQICKGSLNDTIQKTAAKEAESTKYDLFLDFDTCEPFLGVHKGSHKIDINKYGKAVGKGVNKFDINNTSASNKIKFKLFRQDSRQSHRLREFGIGMEASNQGEQGGADKVERGQLAEAEINLSHLNNFYINQPQGFVCPVAPTAAEDLDAKSKGYKVEGVYALFAITITDKTFGELILDLNEFRGIPACPAVEQLSWRVLIKPTVAGASAARIRRQAEEAEQSFDEVKKKGKTGGKSDLDSVGKERIPATFEQRSEPPIKYNMATMGGPQSRLTLTREMVIGIKMKDIFSNKSLFMRGGNDLYAEFDQRIFIELLAATKAGPPSLVGQLEMSLVDLIRKSVQQEDSKASELRRQKAREEQEASKKEEAKEEEAVSGKSAALEQEQAQRVAQAERQKQRMIQHRQEMRELKKKVKAGQAKPEDLEAREKAFEAEQNAEHEEEAKIKRQESEAASAASGKGKSKLGSTYGSQRGGPRSFGGGSAFGDEDPCKSPIPEGFKSVVLPNVEENANEDEKLDFATGNLRAAELQKKTHATRLVFRANWSFSFQKREQRTEAYYAHMADLQELERTRERKKIPNMIEALYLFAGEFSGDSAAATRLTDTMTVLSLVLASESASTAMGTEALESHPLLQNVQELLMAFGSVFIRFQAAAKDEGKPVPIELGAKPIKRVEMPVVPSTVALMRCCLYTKIICKNAGPKYLKKFQAAFEKARLFPHIIEIFERKGKTSRQLATKTLQFVTYMMYDMPELYFGSLSGVRLTPLLEHVNQSPESRADAELISHHSKLVNACCHCLFQFVPSGGDVEHQTAIVKSDTRRLGGNIFDLVRRLIAGEMNSQFKQTFEDIAMPLCESAVRYIHLSIAKFQILNQSDEDKKDTTLSKVFEALFQVLIDAVASGLSMEFIDKVKKQFNYEIQLIARLGVRYELNLLFDGGDVQSRLKKLLDIYLENQEYNQRLSAGLIEETDFRQDMDQYLADSKPILEFFADEDAMNTLGENNSQLIQKILKDPTCSNSSDFILFLHNVVKADLENEDSVKGEGDQARKQRIKKEKYGGIVNINRFSISHIEWLADQMPGLIDI